jgi:hypothetical protein
MLASKRVNCLYRPLAEPHGRDQGVVLPQTRAGQQQEQAAMTAVQQRHTAGSSSGSGSRSRSRSRRSSSSRHSSHSSSSSSHSCSSSRSAKAPPAGSGDQQAALQVHACRVTGR